MWASFVFFFFVLCSWFVLRPIRDLIAVTTGVTRLPWLFGGTLIVTLIANPLFSSLVVRFRVRRFVPVTYQFFAANLLVFFFAMRAVGGMGSDSPPWIGIVFYIWTSVFNLFITSVFWCFMADVFRSEQAKRLFGFIGVGGTLGAIVGSGADGDPRLPYRTAQPPARLHRVARDRLGDGVPLSRRAAGHDGARRSRTEERRRATDRRKHLGRIHAASCARPTSRASPAFSSSIRSGPPSSTSSRRRSSDAPFRTALDAPPCSRRSNSRCRPSRC